VPKAPSKPVLKTLDRVLSKAGVGSRTEAVAWISEGRVTVNGRRATSAEQWVDPARDKVRFDGKPLEMLAQGEKLYVLLYKPTGYLTTYRDPEGRPTIYWLLTHYKQFLQNVGRLDLDTSGLILLTNDSDFANHVTSPESHVPKTYLVKAAGLLTEAQMDRLRQGVELTDGPTRPAQVKFVRHTARQTFLEITITEGRNRQVRRMIEAIDSKVLKLVRTAIGPIEIAGLEIGKHRELTPNEAKALLNYKATRPPQVRDPRPDQTPQDEATLV
jgi:23S rRNA pseudouridine2605 synthase